MSELKRKEDFEIKYCYIGDEEISHFCWLAEMYLQHLKYGFCACVLYSVNPLESGEVTA